MKALIFPGQGSQFPGMGKELHESSAVARDMFSRTKDILGFNIQDIMFEGTAEDLLRTSVTQPAIFLHSVIAAHEHHALEGAGMVAGHSLGEFSALVAAGALSFEDGLRLVATRANAMQHACDQQHGTMAAILGLDDEVVEEVCASVEGIVVPANYNTVGQLVISGSEEGINQAIELAKEKGARRALPLKVNGAFHSPLMEIARIELAAGIEKVTFQDAQVPIYQNVTAQAHTDHDTIKANLLSQLTSPVRWTQTLKAMLADGASSFVEVGPGKALSGMVKRIDRAIEVSQLS